MMELKALTRPWEFSVTGADQTAIARRAEELGYDMLAVPEHFIVPHSHIELSGPHYFHSTVAQAYLVRRSASPSIPASPCCRCNIPSSWRRRWRPRIGSAAVA